MAKKKKIMDLSKVLPVDYKNEEYNDIIDSVGYWKDGNEDKHTMEVVRQAQQCYDNWEDVRRKFLRCKNFTYSGHQWDDLITVDGETMTEADYLMKQGCVPLENNLIRRFIRNIIGVYRNQNKETTCKSRDKNEQRYADVLSVLLQYVNQLNKSGVKDSRALEQALIGGVAVFKHTVGWREHKFDCWKDAVNINDFATDNNASDYTGDDVSMVVQLHELTPQKLISTFAHSPRDIQALKAEYAVATNTRMIFNKYKQFGQQDDYRNYDFFVPQDPNLCRVIEIWNKETRSRYHCWDKGRGELFDIDEKEYDILVTQENKMRIEMAVAAGMNPENVALVECDKKNDWFIDEYWYYRFVTPFGHVLQEGESPYEHKSHPYTMFLYPFINGEIHPFVEDVIPQQKYINRLITMQDWISRASAKGVLLYPEGSFDGQDMEEVAKAWSSPNSILPYKYKPGVAMPQQVSANSTNIGIVQQLETQLALFEDISGVNGALQGKPGYSTTSGTLYAQQTQNSTSSLSDILESFSTFLSDGAYKNAKNILQFYDDNRIMQVVGEYGLGARGNADGVRNMEFDIAVVESTSSPSYRAIANDYLVQFWQAGQITMEMLLENGDFPFGDKLLQSLKAQQEQIQASAQEAQAEQAMLQQQGAIPQGMGG